MGLRTIPRTSGSISLYAQSLYYTLLCYRRKRGPKRKPVMEGRASGKTWRWVRIAGNRRTEKKNSIELKKMSDERRLAK